MIFLNKMAKRGKKIVGILGGGQLGLMLSQAAQSLGFETNIYCPDKESPAFNHSTFQTIGDYEDKMILEQFANKVDYITIEFENIPKKTIDFISKFKKIYPPIDAIEISQDRINEKNFFVKNKINTNKYCEISSTVEFDGWDFTNLSVLKTRKFGYDGKGQKIIKSASEGKKLFQAEFNVPCILEEYVHFTKEVSTISARDIYGNIFIYPPSENVHKNHILDTSCVPANINPSITKKLFKISEKIISKLNYVGVLSIEFFVNDDSISQETIFVNEIAPRVHNSGHWTLDGANISQFEQHIRAISKGQIIEPKLLTKTLMLNIIGDEVSYWNKSINTKNRKIYIYGKNKIKEGRKMGHINFINQD
tara:strand:- start:9745 stop:10836 length:1092 start_codon:yes stop_codon:yes gene_type:complete